MRKKIKSVFCGILLITIMIPLQLEAADKKANVILISVATETEPFWAATHHLAKVAAKDLGVDFEILLSDRHHVKAVEWAKEITARRNKPDYVIVVGEKWIASQSIPILTGSGIKVFMYGGLTEAEKRRIGEPREKFPKYIGKRVIDDYTAGYRTAELMVQESINKKLHDKDGHINFLAFEGVRETSFSSERVRGLNAIALKYPEVRILQSVPTDWTYEYAKMGLPLLLNRYAADKIAGVWCANSELARASADVLKSMGKQPGIDFVTAGTDWNNAAVKRVNNGDILCIAGGHVAAIAWIVLLLHDYHNGIDFDSNVFLNKVTIMDKKFSDIFLKYFSGDDWDFIDFKKYSKAENPAIKEYDLSFEAILNDFLKQTK